MFLRGIKENLGTVFQLTCLLVGWYVAQVLTCFPQQEYHSSPSGFFSKRAPSFTADTRPFVSLSGWLFCLQRVCVFLAFIFLSCLLILGCQLIIIDEHRIRMASLTRVSVLSLNDSLSLAQMTVCPSGYEHTLTGALLLGNTCLTLWAFFRGVLVACLLG